MRKMLNPSNLTFSRIVLALVFIGIIFLLLKTPSNDRDWNSDQQVLPYAEINGSMVQLYNIRNITYRSTSDFDVAHYDRKFNLSELETLDYVVEELEGFPGFAHTLLSFGFENGTQVAISVEIRKEKGESYSPTKGMLREFELMYVIADERDVINLRTNYRNDTVYLYPIDISKESLDKLFISMLKKANHLREEPEFYHTLTSTCTTNLAEAASDNTKEYFFKYHYQILLPGFSDELLLRRGLILTNTTDIEQARTEFNINKQARSYKNSSEFSQGIRMR